MLLPRLRLAPGLLLLCLAARAALGGPAPLNLPGSALWFNGPNDRDPTFLGSMHVPGIVGGAADQITVSAWVKIDRHKTHNLVAISESRAAGWALFIDGAAKACFGLFQKKSLKTISSRPLQQGADWHYVSGVFDGRAITVYVDAEAGEVVPIDNGTLAVPWGSVHFAGAPDWTSLRLEGTLGPAQLWRVARTREELALDMTAGGGGAAPDALLGHWRMDDALPSRVKDSSRHGHDAVFNQSTGTPSWVRSTRPHFLAAEAGAVAFEFREVDGALLSLEKAPAAGEGTVFLVDRKDGRRLAPVPVLPWPVSRERYFEFEKAADTEDVVCSEVEVGCDLLGFATSHPLYLMPAGALSASDRIRGCKRHRFAAGIVPREPPADGPLLTFVCPVGELDTAETFAGVSKWENLLQRLAEAAGPSEVIVVGHLGTRARLAGAFAHLEGFRFLEVLPDATHAAMVDIAVHAAHAAWVHVVHPELVPLPDFAGALEEALAGAGPEEEPPELVAAPAAPPLLHVEECSTPAANGTVGAAGPRCAALGERPLGRLLAAALGAPEAWRGFREVLVFRKEVLPPAAAGVPPELVPWSLLGSVVRARGGAAAVVRLDRPLSAAAGRLEWAAADLVSAVVRGSSSGDEAETR